MRTRADVVAAARACVGTPFHHQARLPGVGLDCIGLTWCAASAAGFDMPVPPCDYPRVAVDETLTRRLDERMDRIEVADARDGDVLAFAFWRRVPQHLGIVTDKGIVHCWTGAGRVAEHAMTRPWSDRCVGAWRFRGIT